MARPLAVLGKNSSIITTHDILKLIALVAGPAGTLVLEPFAPVPPDVVTALESDARAVEAFLSG